MAKNEEAKALIEAAGGGTKFGRLLGIDNVKNFQQRVSNWKSRGIPPEIELEHYDKIQKLRQRVERKAKRSRREIA